MTIGEIIDKVSDNLNRIKTIGVLVLVVFLLLSLIKHGCNRNNIELMAEQLTGLHLSNGMLQNDIVVRDSLLSAEKIHIKRLQDSLSYSDNRIAIIQSQYTSLKYKYNNISKVLKGYTADSTYKFLNKIAYPFPGQQIYKFNEPQIRSIHKTYFEKETLLNINSTLLSENKELINKLSLHDSISKHNFTSLKLIKASNIDYSVIVENKNKEIEIYKKDKKKHRRKNVFKNIIVGGISFIGGVLLAK